MTMKRFFLPSPHGQHSNAFIQIRWNFLNFKCEIHIYPEIRSKHFRELLILKGIKYFAFTSLKSESESLRGVSFPNQSFRK